jgi:hypothetical protein
MRYFHVLLALCALGFVTTLPAADATVTPAHEAGEIILLTGRGTAVNPDGGAVRELGKGDKVYSGEILNAGANTYINVKFSDGAFVLLRPNTRFVIEQYAYAAAPAPAPAAPTAAKAATPAAAPVVTAEAPAVQRAFLRLLKGGFRTVSGLIGKANPDEYRVTTPVATIGIRGTDYYAYICDLACASDPVILASLELEHIDHGLALGATLDGVISGSIAITNAAGHTEILSAGQYMLTLADGRQIRLAGEPQFLRVQPFPDPLTLCAP